MFSNFSIEKFKRIVVPPNHSLKTLSEIKTLQAGPLDTDYADTYDNIVNVFKNLFRNRTRKYPKKLVKDLLTHSEPIILSIKNYHNRQRPNVVANYLSLNFRYHKMKSAQTPSFPSGHSAQAKLVALMLSDLYPEMHNEFITAANHISKSRIAARVHYESDKKVGEELGESLYNHLKNA
jgi:hypothetical protein